MDSFTFKTLLAERRKLVIAFLGVIFSLVLINIQGGMFLGMIRKSTLLVDNGDADIWIGHHGVQNADVTADIPVSWLHRVRGVAGVERADPCIVRVGMLKLPSGKFEGVLVVGSDTRSGLGSPWTFSHGDVSSLDVPDAITIDRFDESRFAGVDIGDLLEINGSRARVTAKTDGILGFITTPYVFTTLGRAREYTSIRPGYCSYILAKVRPGQDPRRVIQGIRTRLPYADIHTSEDFSHLTQMYWITRTGLGMSFGSSTVLGLMVGLVMVSQSFYSFASDNLENYAALKAIGATNRQLAGILVGQGLSVAVVGCLVGHLVSWGVWATISTPRLTITFTPWLLAASTLMAVSLCVFSALLPLFRIRDLDPVVVLQG